MTSDDPVTTVGNGSARRSSLRSRGVELRRGLQILILFVQLGLFLLGFHGVVSYETPITRQTLSLTLPQAVPVIEMYPGHKETSLVAVVAHDFMTSKDMMSGFGEELARAGVTTYLFDFPGYGDATTPAHGRSTSTVVDEKANQKAFAAMVDYVRHHNKVTKTPQIVLIGHAMGATVVANYAMGHSDDDDLLATILVSPVWQGHPSINDPPNLLLLVGENDLAASQQDGNRLMREGCQLQAGQPLPDEKTCGILAIGGGRREVVLPRLNHVSILNASSTFQASLAWLHQINANVKTTNVDADDRQLSLFIGLVCIVLAIFPLCSLLIDIFQIKSTTRLLSGRDVVIYQLILVVSIAVALLVQWYWQPLRFLQIDFADYIGGYLFITALVMGCLSLLLKKRLPVPAFKQWALQIVLGVVLALFLYLTLGELMTFAWVHLTLNLPRFWRFLILFVLILPIFLFDEGINRGYQENRKLLSVFSSLLFKGLLLAGLVIAYHVTPQQEAISLLLPSMAFIFLLLIAFCFQFYQSGRAAFAGALFAALVFTWYITALCPIF